MNPAMSRSLRAVRQAVLGICLNICLAALASLSTSARAQPFAAPQCGDMMPFPPPWFAGGQCQMLGADPGFQHMWLHCNQQLALTLHALACHINAERVSRGLVGLPSADGLMNAARDHAVAAGRQRWWTGGANPHVNPQTQSTPDGRIKASGYCGGNPRKTAEIAYTGWGSANGSAATAINWWMNVSTSGHREIILDPALREIGLGIVGEIADGSAPSNAIGGSYVITFGACQ